MRPIDLHVHSTCSDGTLTPSELVDLAREKGLAAFALTDHDTVDGLEEAVSYARKLRAETPNPDAPSAFACIFCDSDAPQTVSTAPSLPPVPEVIPGIELSTEYRGRDVHIVGLYIDYQNEGFHRKLGEFLDSRIRRNHKMCALLQEAGMDITYEKLQEAFPDSVITRAHYARYMMEQGYTQSLKEAFDRYIGDHCPCYVPREKITPAQAIALILEADGIPVLAHPLLYHLNDENLEELVWEGKEAGLMGIEALYPTHSPAEERQIRRLAGKYHLLLSGGSDFHGSNKPQLELGTGYGKLFVPEDLLNEFQKSRKNLLFTDLDGTLLNNASGLYPPMKEALDRMTARGHRLILTSGRPLPSILEVRKALGIEYPGMLVIANNGALVYDCDHSSNILEYRLSPEDIRYIIGEAEKRRLHIHAYTDTEIVCHGMNAELQFYTRRIHLPLKCVESIPDHLPKGSFKLQCIHLTDRKRLEAFRDRIVSQLGDRIQTVFSNDQYLEILPAQAGKGKAVRFVQEYLCIPHSHTFAAGDAENDISMLEEAQVGIAMANADPAVKEHADLVTIRDNEHNGLAEVLDRYFT